ncbi:coiled-coil and C2 domain-containing protein 1-like isoform X2 [Leptidea sinapis]|uniref:coiled-coil and C2 domain-containing protein 1-like isoform X2 n=1 Tax=Leptidea sinapis TaxID=189913 RepID=UPI0021C408B8|nr:coiled-coil and C2 domain-containing protein 1-like isoform X2 [Leptidea sinapis]
MSRKKGNLSQYGLIDIPDLDNDELMNMSDDDVDLEAELAAITGGAKKNKPRKPEVLPPADLDAMIAASLKDVPSDDEGSGDDDDPDLLSELHGLAGDEPPPPNARRQAPPPPGSISNDSSTISLLQDRITNYTAAEKSAKDAGESNRARRFGRGLKTLSDLLKQAKAGKPINEQDIPPPVSIAKPPSEPQQPEAPAQPPTPDPPVRRAAPMPPPRTESLKSVQERPPTPPEPQEPPPHLSTEPTMDPAKQEGLQFILKRKEEFKAAALACKHAGDKQLALEHLKVVKQFDIVVEAYKSGQEMDLNELPSPEAVAAAFKASTHEKSEEEAAPVAAPEQPGLITASTVDEALKQRLAAFQEQEAKAKSDGNAMKARRMGRIVKQYQDAIRQHAAGKPLPLDELPTPNGYAPIPAEGSHRSPARPSAAQEPARPSPAPAAPRVQTKLTRNDKQLLLLMHRQKEFKEAAIKAKKSGNIQLAKDYLRSAKGFDSLIEATKGGLPVDLNSIPLPPTAKKKIEDTFDIVSAEECGPPDDSSITAGDDDVMSRLHGQLSSQLKLCFDNRDHCRAAGNIAESNRFEHLAVSVKQDLDVVALAMSVGDDPPKFRYENRTFSIVQCNTDLNENELELTIVRGIAYNVPNPREIDTYVKFEFPYPQEAPVSDRTATVKDTNSPQYDAVFPLAIQRTRPCQRVFKRHAIKFTVYSKGGWFSRDTALGTVSVKLAPLENQVTLHESFPLMDGRRPAGGSLEVKLRVRRPLTQPEVVTQTHRWLIVTP